MLSKPRFARIGLCLLMLPIGFSCSWTAPSPLERDFSRIKPGMTVVQVESIMDKYTKTNEGNRDQNASNANPMCDISPDDITYPLNDGKQGTTNGQRIYRARTKRGDWEYTFIDYIDGQVVSIRMLK